MKKSCESSPLRFALAWGLILALTCGSAHGERQRKYGLEQEIRHPLMFAGSSVWMTLLYRGLGVGKSVKTERFDFVARMIRGSYLKRLQAICRRYRDCIVKENRILYPDARFEVRITLDPSVIEITTSPFTLEQLRQVAPRLKRDIYDVPAKLGIRPTRVFSGGHLHFDLESSFGRDPLRLLNYVIDYVNHSELSTGAFLYDPFEAPPPLLTPESREAFKRLLADYDAGLIRDMETLIARLDTLGFHKTSCTGDKCGLNVKTKYKTAEIRSARSHQDIERLIMFIELQDMRMDYLESRSGRLPYLEAGPLLSVEQGVAQFYLYVTEAGGDYERFKRLLPDYWQRIPVDLSLAFQRNAGGVPLSLKCRLFFSDLSLGL